MNNCPDCGTKLSNGICPNCHEESHIMINQIMADGMDITVSDEFAEKVREQTEKRKKKNVQCHSSLSNSS